jgi:hypothetical protein
MSMTEVRQMTFRDISAYATVLKDEARRERMAQSTKKAARKR